MVSMVLFVSFVTSSVLFSAFAPVALAANSFAFMAGVNAIEIKIII